MRLMPSVHLLLVAMPLAIQQCTTGTPVITEITFPSDIPGDGTLYFGNFEWEDPDQGVQLAYLTNVLCPPATGCPDEIFDLAASDPEIETSDSGIVLFNMSCRNTSGSPTEYAWTWSLEDADGNVSVPVEFAYSCQSVQAGE